MFFRVIPIVDISKPCSSYSTLSVFYEKKPYLSTHTIALCQIKVLFLFLFDKYTREGFFNTPSYSLQGA